MEPTLRTTYDIEPGRSCNSRVSAQQSPGDKADSSDDRGNDEQIVKGATLLLAGGVKSHGSLSMVEAMPGPTSIASGSPRRNQRHRLRSAFVGLVSVAVLMTGCAQAIELPDDADDELRNGAEVYRASCARCHGADGGGGIGPSLRGVAERLSPEDQLGVVVNGRNMMPRFDSVLSEPDILAVVRYQREILSGP